MIKYSRYSEQRFRDIIDPVIKRKEYFCHSDNILMTMLTDDKTYQGTHRRIFQQEFKIKHHQEAATTKQQQKT